MEVLNRNQRRSAIWRLLALGFFILSLVAVVLFSMNKAYGAIGSDDYDLLVKEYNNAQQDWEASENDMKNEILLLKKQLKECQEGKADPNKVVQNLEAEIRLKDAEIEQLDRSLTRCNQDLNALRSSF